MYALFVLITLLNQLVSPNTLESSGVKVIEDIDISGTFYISQLENGSWNDKYSESFETQYTEKHFTLFPEDNSLTIRINQKNIPFADIEQIQLTACGNDIAPEYARFVNDQISVLDEILYDDLQVIAVHEKPVEIHWAIDPACEEHVTLALKANEYESDEKGAFRFPFWGKLHETYMFSNTGSLTIDGTIDEVDGVENPLYSPYWDAVTGHPSNNTHIYLRDDQNYVYLALDILLDNTDEDGLDWLKIFVKNSHLGGEKEYRIDDYSTQYGRCQFNTTSHVSYRHQTCEARIPKSEIAGNAMDFVIRYYGTASGPYVEISIDDESVVTIDSTPSITGRASGYYGSGDITSVSYNLYNNTTSEYVVGGLGDYPAECTPYDEAFDSTDEEFSCTHTTSLNPGSYDFTIYATSGTYDDTGVASVTILDVAAPAITLNAITPDPTTDATPQITGTTTDAGNTISTVEFQVDGTSGSWTACVADDGTFDELSEAFTCTTAQLADGEHTIYVRASDANGNTTASGSEESNEFTIDTIPLTISSPQVVTKTESSFTLSWVTNEAGSTQIEYGISENLGSSTTESDSITRVTTHNDTVFNLQKCTTYYYRLQSSDSAGNTTYTEPSQIRTNGCTAVTTSSPAEPQIQTSSNGQNRGGVMKATSDTGTSNQSIIAIVEDDTFPFSANLHSESIKNIDFGYSSPFASIRAIPYRLSTPNGTYYQMGTTIHEIWYDASRNDELAKIIPELQKRPSIISISYNDIQLYTPGAGWFPESSLVIAHSLDGAFWTILPTSVVDMENNTVAAVHKVGGYYMIMMRMFINNNNTRNSVLGTREEVEIPEVTYSPSEYSPSEERQENSKPLENQKEMRKDNGHQGNESSQNTPIGMLNTIINWIRDQF